MNKKIVMSLSVIGAVAAVVIGGTSAFFSDSETSTGNTFTAGAIDLSIGSQFSSNGNANGGPTVMSLLADNNGRALYNFTDLKPGDFGSGSFELKVSSNEAYACAMTEVTGTPENGVVDPEQEAGDVTSGTNDGELQNFLQFAIFADLDGNGMRDSGEPLNVNQYNSGDGNGFTAGEMEAMGWIAVADPSSPNTWLTIGSLAPNTSYDAGFMYCFGNFDANGVCTMSPSTNDNLAQTDGISGSLEFQAVQTRNNANFTCAGLNNSIIRVNTLQPSWDANGGGGVFSAYIGPTAYAYVSPGPTAVYDGRQAGIIKAGFNTTPANDEGLFAVIPNVTINALAAGALTYDVETQFGVNPVWMTIEIDTGVVAARSDNTVYQHVPTTNPAGWHTVNAGAGQWQKWNNNAGDTTGNPLISLSTIATDPLYTGLNVVRTYLRLGMGESYYNGGTGTTAWVDKMTIGGVTYDFVLP